MKKEMNTIKYYTRFNSEVQISKDEEQSLIGKAEMGDQQAKDKLVLSNLRFAGYAAKNNKFSRMDSDDLLQECVYGLVVAANKVKAGHDNLFVTYANSCIRSAIDDANNKYGSSVRLPEKQFRLLKKIKAVYDKNLKLYKNEKTSIKVTAEETGVSEKEVILKLQQGENESSLDNIFSDSDQNGRSYEDVTADYNKSFEDDIIKEDSCTVIRNIVNRLPEKEASVLRLRFGLNGGEPMSFSEIGRRFGFTRSYANNIEKKAVKMLREQYGDELEELIA